MKGGLLSQLKLPKEGRLAILAAINLATTLASTWVVLKTYGAGIENDSLIASATLSQFALVLLANSVIQVATPILTVAPDSSAFQKTLKALSTLVIAVFALLSTLIFATVGYWTSLLFPKLVESDQAVFENLVAINTVGMFLTGVTALQSAAYYATHRFEKAELISVVGSILSLIVTVSTIGKFGIYAAALPAVIRPLVQIAAMRDALAFGAPATIERSATGNFLEKIRPLIVGNSYLKLDSVFDRYILARADSGTLTLVSLTQQLYGALSQIIQKALIGTILADAAGVSGKRDRGQLRGLLKSKLIDVGLSVLIVGIMVAVFALNISKLSIPIKTLTGDQLQNLAWISLCLFGMFAGGLLGGVTSTFFYALGDTKTPTLMSIITFTVYVPVKFIVFNVFGITGFCIAVSVYLLLNFAIMLYLILKLHLGK